MLIYAAIGFCIFVTVSYVIGVYNAVVRLTRAIEQQFANLEVFLKQRHDELAKRVNACQAYMQHERGTLTELTRLRSGYDIVKEIGDKIKVKNRINQVLNRLNHVWENYPDLKANQNFMLVQGRMTGLRSRTHRGRRSHSRSVSEGGTLRENYC